MSDRNTERPAARLQGQPVPLRSLLFGSALTGAGQDGVGLYMLLDTARDGRIYLQLLERGDSVRARSFYQGDLGERLAHVSPYLLSLRPDQPESGWFAEPGFGQSWGLFLITFVGFDELRRHLRKFNIVYRENGTPAVFRYHDPRVLRRFLPTCTADELRRFFGPIESFLAETEEADALIRFTLRGDELMQTRLPVQV
jgi:Domain of unknown function (DUF4123)